MKPDYKQAFEQLDHCLDERMQAAHNPGMVIALTDSQHSVRIKAYGYACLESQTPLEPDHLFAIGSIGKSFTGIAALQASQAGLIDLHAPVKEILPWFELKSHYEPVTPHHLLTHSSGLVLGSDFSPDARAEAWALRDLEVGFAPGRHLYYSDAGYKVMGLVLEAAYGKPYAQIIQEGILQPLGMTNTYAVTSCSLRPHMATGYRSLYTDRPAHPSLPLVQADFVETNSGDGCIVSTAEDMARFARMLLNVGRTEDGSEVLTLNDYYRMVTPMIREDGEAYSYGLTLFEDDGYRIAGHGGDVPGYESYLWLDLDNSLGTVVLMTSPYTPRASFLALEYFRAAYLGHRLPEQPPLPDFTHVSRAEEYLGCYQSMDGAAPTLCVEAEGSRLYLVTGKAGEEAERVLMEEREDDLFYIHHPNYNRFLLRFEREHGKVTEASYGPYWYTNERYSGPLNFDTPAEWKGYSGHYRAHNPWYPSFRVFARKGRLIMCLPSGEEEYLVPLGENTFRIGEESYIPERMVFDMLVEGESLRATRSGCPYYRFFMP